MSRKESDIIMITGKEEYENGYLRKIKKLLKENSNKSYLVGYYSFIKPKRTLSTTHAYLSYVINFMDYIHKDIKDLNLDDYTSFMMSIDERTSSYKIAVYSALKKFAEYLIASHRTQDNPMVYVERPRAIESEETKKKREIGYLNTKEIKEYLDTVKTGIGSNRAKTWQKEWEERDLAIILLFLNTGMRCSALYKLDVDSINFSNNVLVTNDKENKINTYELSDEVIEYIKKWLIKRKNILNGKEENALFISYRKERMGPQGIAKIVSKYAQNIKGKHITPHKLRATYGTQLYNTTKDLVFVQEAMKHNNPKTTELYIRGNKDQNRKKVANIMSRITMEGDD